MGHRVQDRRAACLAGQQEHGTVGDRRARRKVTNIRGIPVLYKEVRNLRGRQDECCRERVMNQGGWAL